MRHLAKFSAAVRPVDRSDKRTAPWWPVFRDLREARSAYGLKARHLTTLAALLTFLPDSDEEMIVFASNRAILERLNGLCERTFQRHIGDLIEAGLLRRNDSSNGKRFRIRRSADTALSYGFDLSPLMEQAFAIAEAAEAERDRATCVAMLRQQILKLLSSPDMIALSPAREAHLRPLLRRNQSVAELQGILSELKSLADHHHTSTLVATENLDDTTDLSASDRHFVGHFHKSKEKITDMNVERVSSSIPPDSEKLLDKLRKSCPMASAWLAKGLLSWREVLGQMRQLASWIGISGAIYAKAESQNGKENTAATLLAIVESAEKIRQPAAYFYAVTLGRRSRSFSPHKLLGQLAIR